MAHITSLSLFPSYLPSFPNFLWLDCESSSMLPSLKDVQKEEEEYNIMMKKEVSTKITAIGQAKDIVEQNGGEDEDLDEDEESNDDVEDDTDEFDTASPELDSMEDDAEMMNDTSGINETSDVW